MPAKTTKKQRKRKPKSVAAMGPMQIQRLHINIEQVHFCDTTGTQVPCSEQTHQKIVEALFLCGSSLIVLLQQVGYDMQKTHFALDVSFDTQNGANYAEPQAEAEAKPTIQ